MPVPFAGTPDALPVARSISSMVTRDPDTPQASAMQTYYKPMKEGFRVDEDARDVYREAMRWWDEQLTRLEAALNRADQQATGRGHVSRSPLSSVGVTLRLSACCNLDRAPDSSPVLFCPHPPTA